MKMNRWASLALTAVVCLIVEGALVAGLVLGLGSLLYPVFGHSVLPPVPRLHPRHRLFDGLTPPGG
jgi:hypothetical protein